MRELIQTYREKQFGIGFNLLRKAVYYPERGSLYGFFYKKEIKIMHIQIIRNMYDEVRTNVKIVCRETKDFTVNFHRKSSPYLFSPVTSDELTKGVRNANFSEGRLV